MSAGDAAGELVAYGCLALLVIFALVLAFLVFACG
jgi:hypothetical protein